MPLVAWRRADARCDRAAQTLFVFGATRQADAGAVGHAAVVVGRDCPAVTAATAAQQLRLAGRASLAITLARHTTQRSPSSFDAWLALGDAQRTAGNEIQAGAAWGRAWRLNPRWRPPELQVP